jgi:hypothetical protein
MLVTTGPALAQGPTAITAYNVRDYGAKGDGATEDQVAVQNAINAANAAGGGIVYFPPGTYLVRSPSYETPLPALSIPGSRITLRGAGMGLSTLFNDRINNNRDGSFVVNCGTNADDLAFEDLCFQNAGTTYVPNDGGIGLLRFPDTLTFNRVRVERCRFLTNNRVGITNGSTLSDFRFEDCLIEGSAEEGIYLAGNCIRGIVRHNVIRVPNTPVTGSVGIKISQCTDLLCEGNYIENHGLYGILVSEHVNQRVQILGNKIRNGPTNAAAIGVSQGEDILVANNQVDSYPYGVDLHLLATSKDITVVGNQIRGTTYNGIRVSGTQAQPSNVDVRNNQLSECGQGIRVEDVTAGPVVVSGNTVWRSSNVAEYGVANINNTTGTVTWGRNRVTGYTVTDVSAIGPDQTVALAYAGTVNSVADLGRRFTLTVTDGGPFTIANPSNAVKSQTITYDILNSSSGAMGTVTWDTAFKLAGTFANPANTKRRTITFYYDGTNWIEISRAGSDI